MMERPELEGISEMDRESGVNVTSVVSTIFTGAVCSVGALLGVNAVGVLTTAGIVDWCETMLSGDNFGDESSMASVFVDVIWSAWEVDA